MKTRAVYSWAFFSFISKIRDTSNVRMRIYDEGQWNNLN